LRGIGGWDMLRMRRRAALPLTIAGILVVWATPLAFGASAPLKQLLKKFDITAEHVVAAAKSQIARHGSTK